VPWRILPLPFAPALFQAQPLQPYRRLGQRPEWRFLQWSPRMPVKFRTTGCWMSIILSIVLTILLNLMLRGCNAF
jgi:hypothetical protein